MRDGMHLYRHARVPWSCLGPSACGDQPLSPFEPWIERDLLVAGGRFEAVVPCGAADGRRVEAESDLGGRLVFPRPLDAHTHLDRCHTWTRSPNLTGDFQSALIATQKDRSLWSEADLYQRMNYALSQMHAHGTVAVRTHLDGVSELGRLSHSVCARLRLEWADKLCLQTVSCLNPALFGDREAGILEDICGESGTQALGAFLRPGPRLVGHVEALMATACRHGLGIDLHVDETEDPTSECLRAVAEAVVRHGFPHPVLCGHACSLAMQERKRAWETIDLVKEAGITIVTLPFCNLYLQGRPGPEEGGGAMRPTVTPRWRGLTLIHEFLAAGVPVIAASDNVRDAFHPWGDFNLLDVLATLIRVAHLEAKVDEAVGMITARPAAAMGLPGVGTIGVGMSASALVLPARTFNEWLSRGGQPSLLEGDRLSHTALPEWIE
jgi:cytosine deaminase